MRKAACAAAVAALAAAGLGACSEPKPRPVDFAEATHSYRAKDYERVRDTWTRHGKVVSDVGTVIEGWATLKSWDFRQAYVEFYADIYGLTEPDRADLLRTQLEASRAGYEFHVVVQTTNYRWNDLEHKASPWRVSMLDGTGAAVVAESISVQKLPEIYEIQFFPNRTAFSRSYVIRFPRGQGGESDAAHFAGFASGKVVLRFASPMGRADLEWSGL